MTANIPQISITAQGRSRAMELLSQNQYTGAAPVALESYIEQTLRQSVRNVEVHAADVEGLCRGIDGRLVMQLGAASPIPVTYAGGATSLADLETVTRLGNGRVDLTIGSALDLFGGAGVRYADAVAFNRRQAAARTGPAG